MDAQLNPPLARFANCSRTWWRRTSNGIGDDSWPAAWSPWSCSAWSSRRPFFWPGARIPRPRGHPSPPAFLSRSGSPAPYPRKASTGHGSPVNIYIFLIFNKINKILQYLLDLLDSRISSFIVDGIKQRVRKSYNTIPITFLLYRNTISNFDIAQRYYTYTALY